MKFKILLPTLVLISALILAGCSTASSSGNFDLLGLKNVGKIEPMGSMFHDWEQINIKGGKVDHTYRFKNTGEDDLIIKRAITSCMCTTATIAVGNTLSPVYGMHNNRDWGYAVKPGQEFTVKVVFDPMAHGPNAVGPIDRSVYLSTSSIENGNYAKWDSRRENMVTEIKVRGNVLSESDYEKWLGKEGTNSKKDSEKSRAYQNIDAKKFDKMLASKDFFLVDVHIPEQEHIEKTDAFIPYNTIEKYKDQLPKDKSKKIVVYCRSGSMSLEASEKLAELGYTNVMNLEGGRNAYIKLTQ